MIRTSAAIPRKRYYVVSDIEPTIAGTTITFLHSEPGTIPYIVSQVVYASSSFVMAHIHFKTYKSADQVWRYYEWSAYRQTWNRLDYRALSAAQRAIVASHWEEAGIKAKAPCTALVRLALP